MKSNILMVVLNLVKYIKMPTNPRVLWAGPGQSLPTAGAGDMVRVDLRSRGRVIMVIMITPEILFTISLRLYTTRRDGK